MNADEIVNELRHVTPTLSDIPDDAIKALVDVLLRTNTTDVFDTLTDMALGVLVDYNYEHIENCYQDDNSGVFKIGNYVWKFNWEFNSYEGFCYDNSVLKLATKTTRTIEVYE